MHHYFLNVNRESVRLHENLQIPSMKSFYRLVPVLFLSFVLLSCGGNKPDNPNPTLEDKIAKDTTSYNKMADYKFFYALANLPSPLEIINTVFGTDVEYRKELLNPESNADKYQTTFQK